MMLTLKNFSLLLVGRPPYKVKVSYKVKRFLVSTTNMDVTVFETVAIFKMHK